MLKSNINEVTVGNIPFLSFLLDKFQQREQTPLVEALKLALPMAMQLKVHTQIGEQSPKILIDCLSFVLYNNMNQDIVEVSHLSYPREESIPYSICTGSLPGGGGTLKY